MVALARRWYASADPAVCADFTDALLVRGWGKGGAQGRARCRRAIARAAPVRAVVVGAPVVEGGTATVKVSYTKDGARRADELEFVLVGGAWRVNRVSPGSAPAPAPAASAARTSTGGASGATPAATAPPKTQAPPQTSTGAPVSPVAQRFATLRPVGERSERGRAALRGTPDGKTFAVVFMHYRSGPAQAVEIVRGSCTSPGAALYRLPDLHAPAGVSAKTLPVELGGLPRAAAVVVHAAGAASPIAACGELSAA